MLKDELTQDVCALLPGQISDQGATRRTALKFALGTGYAAAVMPVMAQSAIKTSTEGLTAGEISVKVNGVTVPAYRAAPAGKTHLPVVLVISEIFGVHEYIADVCRRLAKVGYMAIAPELFVRQGDPNQYGEIAKLMSEVVAKVPDVQVAQDLDAMLEWAGANGGDLKRVGVTGFCWGGRQVWLYAAHSRHIRAAVSWYGRLVGDRTPLTPKQPLDVAQDLHAPVLGLYGGKDGGIPLDVVGQMKGALASLAVGKDGQLNQAVQDAKRSMAGGNVNAQASEFVIYPEAPHAFHADYRPSYRREAAEDGWARCLAWFKAHGVS